MNIQSLKEQVSNLKESSEFGISTQQLFTAHLLLSIAVEEGNLKYSMTEETMIQHFNL